MYIMIFLHMATLHYSFLPSMKLLFYSTLLISLFSCYLQTSQASVSHFHTIDINSHLQSTSSVCRPAGWKERQPSALEVVHRRGPCVSQAKHQNIPSLDQILSKDQLRVKSIHARLNANTNDQINKLESPIKPKSKSKAKQAHIPALPGLALDTGDYYVRVGLGTPKKTLSLIFDTGSDLTWTQCQPCLRHCYPQRDRVFNPSSSCTYSNISCRSHQCSQLIFATSSKPGCYHNSTCVYGVKYGDGSYSIGFFSRDTLTITPTDKIPKFLFGCGQNNTGLFGKISGLLGLGSGPLSFVSQTAKTYERVFSYCLPSNPHSKGFLAFGKNNKSTEKPKFTTLISKLGYYFIELISIAVNGTPLKINPSVFKTTGTIIDSGTVITSLQPAAYKALSHRFRKVMNRKYPSTDAFSILDTCFDTSKHKNIAAPPVSFTFNNNVTVDLNPSGILYVVNSTVACLAFAGNTDPKDIAILGNIQQQDFEVVYDVARGKLGFLPNQCNH